MSDIKLFRVANGAVDELQGRFVAVEKSLQVLIEGHLQELLGVRFLASEYSTGKTHAGRIDTLGIDENGSPVIVEYKRAVNQNVINQGLFYLDWLLDHKAEFELLVRNNMGPKTADAIEWGTPRLLCVAGNFDRYDEHAVQQMGRNIELIRYRRYGDDLLLLELVNTVSAPQPPPPGPKGPEKTFTDKVAQASPAIRDIYGELRASLESLGDDVQVKTLKYYQAFRRIKNFACVEVHNQKVLVFVKVDPAEEVVEPGFTRDVRNIGHYGTGSLEITLKDTADVERAAPLLSKSYEAS